MEEHSYRVESARTSGSEVSGAAAVAAAPTRLVALAGDHLARDRWTVGLAFVVVLLALAAGVFARVAGLGVRPLAVDEYYFLLSVEAIFESGSPLLPGGGYYVRALPLQYLTAAIIQLVGEPHLGLRIPSVLLGLATPIAAYYYGARLRGAWLGAALAVVLLVSSWEIEFSQFGRMYQAFQLLTVLFAISLHDVMHGATGARRYLPHLWVALAFLIHSLGIFLLPLLFLPLFTRRSRERTWEWASAIRYLAAGAALSALVFIYEGFNFRNLGVTDRFPADYATAGGGWPLFLPAFPFWSVGSIPLINLAFVLGALCAVGVGLWVLRGTRWRVSTPELVGALMVLAALLHQLLFVGVLGFLLVARYGAGPLRGPGWARTLAAAAALISAGWLAFAIWLTYGAGDRAWLSAANVPVFRDGIRRVFFGWPEVYLPVIKPWSAEMPLLSALLLAGLGVQAVRLVRQPLREWGRGPLVVIGFALVCLGTFDSGLHATRYAYFLYPLALAVLFLSLHDIVFAVRRRIGGVDAPIRRLSAYIVGAGVVLFAFTEDFGLDHIRNVAGDEVSYRIGAHAGREATWYIREDYRTPAELLNSAPPRGREGIIAADVPPVSYYLERDHAAFYPLGSLRFRNVSREAGTVDFWTGSTLLSTPEDLRAFVAGLERVWVLRRADRWEPVFDIEETWGDRVRNVESVYAGRDGRVEVVRVDLSPGRAPR